MLSLKNEGRKEIFVARALQLRGIQRAEHSTLALSRLNATYLTASPEKPSRFRTESGLDDHRGQRKSVTGPKRFSDKGDMI